MLQARLTISSPLEAHKSNTIVFHIVGVDVGFENPLFACLEIDYEEADNDPTGRKGGHRSHRQGGQRSHWCCGQRSHRPQVFNVYSDSTDIVDDAPTENVKNEPLPTAPCPLAPQVVTITIPRVITTLL
jgi:hypothetical protein